MSESSPEERFYQVASAILNLPVEEISRESSRENTPQWDSLKHIHLVMALEEEFDIEFDDTEVSGLSDAGALLDAISGKSN